MIAVVLDTGALRTYLYGGKPAIAVGELLGQLGETHEPDHETQPPTAAASALSLLWIYRHADDTARRALHTFAEHPDEPLHILPLSAADVAPTVEMDRTGHHTDPAQQADLHAARLARDHRVELATYHPDRFAALLYDHEVLDLGNDGTEPAGWPTT